MLSFHVSLIIGTHSSSDTMSDFTQEKPSALENASDVSDHGEKTFAAFQNTDDSDLPDPHEGKSPEERAKIVRARLVGFCWPR